MNRIDARFQHLRAHREKGLVAYMTAGDGGLAITEKLLHAFARAGVDVAELGVPFSDPLADGVINQKAAERALAHATTLSKILALVRRFRCKNDTLPIVLFTYFNPVHRYGVEKFVRNAAASGVDGFLVLDLPPEEEIGYEALVHDQTLRHIHLLAPTTPEARIRSIARHASGFLYYVSREGVTGMQRTMAGTIASRVAMIRRHTTVPIAVGFGISTPAQAKQVAATSDAVVVGSAIVNRIEKFGGSPRVVTEVEQFVKSLARAVKGDCR